MNSASFEKLADAAACRGRRSSVSASARSVRLTGEDSMVLMRIITHPMRQSLRLIYIALRGILGP